MAKPAKSTCDRCESRIVVGDSFCDSCGCPTSWASHSERTAWEVAQYRHKSANVPMGFAYEPAPKPVETPVMKSRGVVRMFSRRAHVPQLQRVEPKRVEPPVATQPAPVVQPKPVAPATPIADLKPIVKVKRAVEAKPAIVVEPSKSDDEPVRDTPATLLAMRLLNARVAELDEKLRRLENEIASSRVEKPRRWFRV